jgi:hypothetical protein
VDAYVDAVDHVDCTDDLGQEWQRTEVAHDEAEQARSALLRLRRKPGIAYTQSLIFEEVPDDGSEEFVLGDVGQKGG